MNHEVTVLYSTEAFKHKNADFPAKQFEHTYQSVEDAKAAPFAHGCNFASFRCSDGLHVRKLPYGWEFHPATLST